MGFHYDYKIAKTVLSEADWNRLACVLLSSTDSIQPDWDRASAAYGSASINSFRIMYNGALKKIADAGGKYDKATNIAQPSGSGSKSSRKPKTPNKADIEGDDEERNMSRKKKSGTESGGEASKASRAQNMADILGNQDATPVKLEGDCSIAEESPLPKSALKRKGKSRQESSPAKRVTIKEETELPSTAGDQWEPTIHVDITND